MNHEQCESNVRHGIDMCMDSVISEYTGGSEDLGNEHDECIVGVSVETEVNPLTKALLNMLMTFSPW